MVVTDRRPTSPTPDRSEDGSGFRRGLALEGGSTACSSTPFGVDNRLRAATSPSVVYQSAELPPLMRTTPASVPAAEGNSHKDRPGGG